MTSPRGYYPPSGATEAQHRLVTWLLVRDGLSMLARYHLVSWLHMLDVGHSTLAAILEWFVNRGNNCGGLFAELAIPDLETRASRA